MAHADILDSPDSLRRPLIVSAAFHVGIVALAVAYTGWIARSRESWGSNIAGGGAVEVGSVKTIPIPGRVGRANPLANDTDSQVPEPPPDKRMEKSEPKPQPDAIPLWRDKSTPRQQQTARRNLPPERWRENQLFSAQGQAAVSQMYRMPGGGGSIGVGPGVFGQRFGAYTSLIVERIAQQWQTAGLDPRSQRAPAIITFNIHRDGSVDRPVTMQSSGNYNVDTTAQRAIVLAAPFPPLPAQYNGDSANVEVRFNLK
jgi:protein TonB